VEALAETLPGAVVIEVKPYLFCPALGIAVESPAAGNARILKNISDIISAEF